MKTFLIIMLVWFVLMVFALIVNHFFFRNIKGDTLQEIQNTQDIKRKYGQL